MLDKAEKDHAAIEEDYRRQYRACVRFHGRQATDDELVTANMGQLPHSFFKELEISLDRRS